MCVTFAKLLSQSRGTVRDCALDIIPRSGQYDYYAYIEDDIVVTDALFLSKRHLFDQRFGPEALLQPQSL